MKETWLSLFNIHNETGNVWTHLIGFLLFFCLTVYIAMAPPAPLAFSLEQTNKVWHKVQDLLLSKHDGPESILPSTLVSNLHQLQQGLHTRVSALQDNLQHGASYLQGTVHSLSETVQHKAVEWKNTIQHMEEGMLYKIQDKLQHMLAPEGPHDGEDSLFLRVQENLWGIRRHVRDTLETHLSPILQYPTVRWPVYVYMAGAMICLLTSSLCHLLGCCAQHVAKVIWRFDYAAIAVLIVASFYPPVYYGFLCEPFWRNFYLVSTTCMGLGTLGVSLLPFFQGTKFRPFRAAMFAALGLWGLAPSCHQLILNWESWHVRMACLFDTLMGATYLSGAFLYATRIPERYFPGKFDLAFHSHQLFHVAVVVAAVIHFKAVMLLLEWRDASGGCAMPLKDTLPNVLRDIHEAGHELFGIEQVWEKLGHKFHEYLGLPV